MFMVISTDGKSLISRIPERGTILLWRQQYPSPRKKKEGPSSKLNCMAALILCTFTFHEHISLCIHIGIYIRNLHNGMTMLFNLNIQILFSTNKGKLMLWFLCLQPTLAKNVGMQVTKFVKIQSSCKRDFSQR